MKRFSLSIYLSIALIAFSCSKSDELTQDVIQQQDTPQSLLRVSNNSNVILTPAAAIADGDDYSTQDAILLVESMLNENHTTKNSTYYNVLHSTTTIADFTNSSRHTGVETQNLYNQASNFVSSLVSEVPPIAIDISESEDDGTVQIDVIFPDEPLCPNCPTETVAEQDGPDCENYDDLYQELMNTCMNEESIFASNLTLPKYSGLTGAIIQNVFNYHFPQPDNHINYSTVITLPSYDTFIQPCFDDFGIAGNPCVAENLSAIELDAIFCEILIALENQGLTQWGWDLIAIEMTAKTILTEDGQSYSYSMNFVYGISEKCCNCCC